MKILICCGGYNSFKENKVTIFALDQAKALCDYGHDVRICAGDVRSIRRLRPWGRWQYKIDGIKVYTANFPCGPLPNCIFRPVNRWVARRCYDLATQDGWTPDIVHAHFYQEADGYVDLVKQKGIPFVVTEHCSEYIEPHEHESAFEITHKLYRSVNGLLVVSNALGDAIKKYDGINPKIISNVVDVKSFDRKRMLDNKIFRFVCCAALIKSKAQDAVIRAFVKLKKHNAELIIMGDGPERSNLENLSRQLGISDRVRFTGKYKREQMAEELAKANCFVLASRFETFGVVYIEAMAAGVPVIATDCGGPRDFVCDKVGVLVPVDDVDALAGAMQNMVDGKVKYDSEEIKQYAIDNFSPMVIAEKLTGVYENVLGERWNS